MTSYTYLDTGALVRHAEGAAAQVIDRAAQIRPHLTKMLNDSDAVVACSEITLVEFHDVLTTYLRAGGVYDGNWWEECRRDLWERVDSGSILVLPTPPRVFDQVMALITLATKEHGRKLKAWDAMHLFIAARWAFELGAKVKLVTSDGDLDVASILGFEAYVDVVNLDVLASTGCGADRR